jgi:hypothetical protein
VVKTAKKRRLKWAKVRAQLEDERTAGGGRHHIDISEREQLEASRLHRPLAGAADAINAQLQTPEAWAWVWRDE